MAREFIGLIVGTRTRRVYSLINPDDDAELDSPHHLQLENDRKEPVEVIKLRRDAYHQPDNEVAPINCLTGEDMTPADVYNLIVRYYVISGLANPQTGPDHFEGAL